MGESSLHVDLVKILIKWISLNLLDYKNDLIMIDGSLSNRQNTPPKIYGFIPDTYVTKGPKDLLIIGEAKTAKDLETLHTKRQLEAFLRKCAEHGNAILIIAVPWDLAAFAKCILTNLKRNLGCDYLKTRVVSNCDIL